MSKTDEYIQRAFSRRAFVPYVTCGDPDMETTEKMIREMAKYGADMIQLGIPFSDPASDGPTIQSSDERALAAGTTTDSLFDMLVDLRKDCDVPIYIMTYYNPVFVYGNEKFLTKCEEAGICGLYVPDVPFEEKEELESYCTRHDVRLISTVVTGSGDRIPMIVSEAEGFVYVIPAGLKMAEDIEMLVAEVRKHTELPILLGPNIDNPYEAARLTQFVDGIVSGHAVMELVAGHGRVCIPHVLETVKHFRYELDR